MTALNELPLHRAAALTVAREIKALDLVEACIARIEEREPTVGAFQVFDPDQARDQATHQIRQEHAIKEHVQTAPTGRIIGEDGDEVAPQIIGRV